MKKFLGLLVGLMMVFGLVGSAGAAVYTESYTGSQAVWEGEAYNFEFDMWYTNAATVNTNSSLLLTSDAAAGDDLIWNSVDLTIGFHSTDWYDDEWADITVTAYDSTGSNSSSFIFTMAFDEPFTTGATNLSMGHSFTTTELAMFETWGWGNVNIAATAGAGSWGDNDFDITEVTMTLDANPVPEPATMLLFGLGLLGLAGVRASKKKK